MCCYVMLSIDINMTLLSYLFRYGRGIGFVYDQVFGVWGIGGGF